MDPARQHLHDLLDRHQQLSSELAREKNRLQKAVAKTVISSLKRNIRSLEKELLRIDAAMEKTVRDDPFLTLCAKEITQTKGAGKITALTLLAYLSELPRLTRNQAVAMAGLAPYDHQSGTHEGKRFIQGGRAKVRRVLYMAATSASIHNPVIRDYVQKLLQRGKPYKCAIVAAMRKLLIHIQSNLKKLTFSVAH